MKDFVRLIEIKKNEYFAILNCLILLLKQFIFFFQICDDG